MYSIPLNNTPGDVKVIHVTDRQSFKECRKKYQYAVISRLSSAEKQVNALWIGTGGHFVLGERYEAMKNGEYKDELSLWNTYKDSRPEPCPGDLDLMMQSCLKRYVDKYDDIDADYKIIMVEQTFQVVIPGTEIVLQGTVDLLVEKWGSLWIVDHKFLRDFKDPRVLEMDDQMTAYIWMLKQHGIHVKGAIYNMIRKKIPTVPKLLKNGSLSVAKNIDTTYDVYLQTLKDNKLDPDDYVEMLDYLHAQEDEFFRRETIVRNAKEQSAFEQDLIHEIADMTSPSTHYYLSPGLQCKWCQFQPLCKAEREGSDVKLLLDAFYRVREDHER